MPCVSSRSRRARHPKIEGISSVARSPSTKPYFVDHALPTVDDANRSAGPEEKTAVVAGATGYIGRAVVRECLSRGYRTVALVRNSTRILSTAEGRRDYGEAFGFAADGIAGGAAAVVECDVTKEEEVQRILEEIAAGKHLHVATEPTRPPPVDVLVSCLASPSGIESEVYAVDYRATLNFLNAGRSVNARHFVLLSAFCCRNPLLKLQQAKLKFEQALQSQTEMTYSIVRPTAFFKSVSGQFESILQGNSYVLFGDGAVTRCNPISEEDLAQFMLDCASPEMKDDRWGKILNVGGPDNPLTNKMLGEVSWNRLLIEYFHPDMLVFQSPSFGKERFPDFRFPFLQSLTHSFSSLDILPRSQTFNE